MPRYEIIQNTPLEINFNELLNDRGWELNGDTATHYSCNVNSELKLVTYNIEPNVNYTVSFKIVEMNSSPLLQVGFGTPLYSYTTPQEVSIPFSTTTSGQKLTFWGSGYIKLQVINIKREGEDSTTASAETITWSEKTNRWVSFRSYRPEKGFSMFTDMFTYMNGNLWVHRDSANRNNFYNQQFQTRVQFPTGAISIKNYQSVAIHSNIIMATTTDGVTTSLGHVSDLIETDFTKKEGIWYANFLRDKMTGMINGERLKGRFLVMELETIDGSKKLQLFKITVKSAISSNNE